VTLLDVDPGADTNRTVYTFIGAPEAVEIAAIAAAKVAFSLIDMSRHTGAHPRMGALDVCPFVPVSGVTMEDCVGISKRVGEAIARELGVPVYLYASAATRPDRKSLADVREGEYEALPDKLPRSGWEPDFGPAEFVPSWGATAVGAREFLIAYNVNLNTRDKRLANEIALTIREGGRAAKDGAGNPLKDASGKTVKVPGLLKEVRAIGWYIDSYKCAQVSINLMNYRTTPFHFVYDTVRAEAEKLGLIVTGSEVVGLLPLEPLTEAGKHYLRMMGKSEGVSEGELVETAIRSMGLASVAPFEPAKKIVEYAGHPDAPLAAMKVRNFVDEVASESPAPGGGSVSALAGALGAAMAAMVANLTVGKKGYEAAWAEMSDLATKSQGIKASLVRAVDEDTAAFNDLMEAMSLPKATEEQKRLRGEALQKGYRIAAEVPLQTAETCLEAIRVCIGAAAKGNANSASDVGVGALLARAAVEGAVLNVLINLGSITDAGFVAGMKERSRKLVDEAERLKNETMDLVMETIKA
jgi:glutamate formiminotransferase/formiminotetrahydrofolate cyclodeaminase